MEYLGSHFETTLYVALALKISLSNMRIGTFFWTDIIAEGHLAYIFQLSPL